MIALPTVCECSCEWAGGPLHGSLYQCMNVCVTERMLAGVAKRFEWSVKLQKHYLNTVC